MRSSEMTMSLFTFIRSQQVLRYAGLALVFAAASACPTVGFTPLPIGQGSTADQYVGHGRHLEVLFTHEGQAGEVDVFPEPPLVIKQRKDGKQCKIEEGGIWVRKSVFLDASEQHLLVHEYSGSNDSLVIYRTSDCKTIKTIDVSGLRWQVEGSQLVTGKACSADSLASCKTKRKVPLITVRKSTSPQ